MNKIVLVDGNNLLFRSYYATAYNGNFMKNSKNFPTNALFGFTNMMNKIILEEKPNYIIVAFDKGKTFRHDKYEDYKGGRIETPDELKVQFPIAKELLTYMGIKYYEIDNYEADDIIGTFAQYCDDEPDFIGTIISSDKDLLQLISSDVDIKLLKQKDYIRYNVESFKENYGIEPINIIDLKALMGDASDNIPGVKGIGEKTALKLLQEYKTLDNIYQHIDDIKGKIKEKLLLDKDNAYKSYDLATIVRDVPMDITLDDIKYKAKDHQKLNALYEELEFYSFLKKDDIPKEKEVITVNIIDNMNKIKLDGDYAVYLEILGNNYHTAKPLGLSFYNDKVSFFITFDNFMKNPDLGKNIKYTYDLKKLYVVLKWHGIMLENVTFDTEIAAYLLDYNVKDDIAYLANNYGYDIPFYDSVYGKSKLSEPSIDVIAESAIMKAKFIYETKSDFFNKLADEDLLNLFKNIKPFGMPRKAVIFFIVVVIMAPGIVVNSILKENVGRPRPIHITEYGGTAVFQPPFVISNQCENNCSFVSGHAAFAFTFMVIGLLFRNRLRHIICTSGFIFGALVGFVRIFQGKHFFTDVVFAFFFTWLTITLIYKFFYPNDQLPDIIQKN